MNPDELLPTRHSLIERLRNLDDQASWREFFDMYWKLISPPSAGGEGEDVLLNHGGWVKMRPTNPG